MVRVTFGCERACPLNRYRGWAASGSLDQIDPLPGASFFLAAFLANTIDDKAMALNLELLISGEAIAKVGQLRNLDVQETLALEAVEMFGRFGAGIDGIQRAAV